MRLQNKDQSYILRPFSLLSPRTWRPACMTCTSLNTLLDSASWEWTWIRGWWSGQRLPGMFRQSPGLRFLWVDLDPRLVEQTEATMFRHLRGLHLGGSVVDPHWFQCGSGCSFLLSQRGSSSGSSELKQCGSMRLRILVRLPSSQTVDFLL